MRGYAYYTREVIYSKTLVRGLISNWSNLLQMCLVVLLGKQHRRVIVKTKTIDQRLRDKADDELHRRLNQVFRQLSEAIEILGTTDRIKVKTLTPDHMVNENGKYTEVEAYNADLLISIKDEAFKKLSPKYQEREIFNFLKKVESLDAQIQNLYDIAGE